MPMPSPFADITKVVNNFITPKLEPTKSVNLPTFQPTSNNNYLLLAEKRSLEFTTKEAPTKPAPTNKDFITNKSVIDADSDSVYLH